MNFIKRITFLLAMFILMASFSQCSSAQKLQKEIPVSIDEVYCQRWTAGIQGGGSGLNIFIPVSSKAPIVLDSVYFRGQAAKLEVKSNTQLYIGRFKTAINQPKQDVILSTDMAEEYNNQLPKKATKIPFELNDDECVVSYQKENKTLYFKITNISEKEALNYPSAPPNRQ